MTELAPILESLRSRADELKTLGPGRVVVAPVNHLGQVQSLRTCREALAPADQLEIRQAILEMESHLHGITTVSTPVTVGLLDRFKTILGGGGAEPEDVVTAVAPPKPLLDAAEAWAVAELARGQVDVDLDALTTPWLEATVESTDGPDD